MTIDWKTVSRDPQEFEFTYTWKDVVLYALGIGAQTDELSFIYENTPGGLQVFPSFATKASGKLLIDLQPAGGGLPVFTRRAGNPPASADPPRRENHGLQSRGRRL